MDLNRAGMQLERMALRVSQLRQLLAMMSFNLTYDFRVQQFARRAAWVAKGRLNVPIVMAALSVAMLVWIIAGIRLRGAALLLWLLVPAFSLAACLCVAGPGRLFSKRDHEGRVVFEITRKDSVTMLDIVGLGLAGFGMLLALALVGWRIRSVRQQAT